ncbi:hypothetical protein EAH89_10565 [Roseomonas nepalensis]|uniref:Uncharacterized protein n=2 Tax=Muricoccus nepalensis TaxID=1854500 RepID=A0A502G8M6_9PROT|nr:hypothetical protein EAH89_10565 [Roseomonas nepalensis]
MHERLIELWLDSASERGYQPGFVQMLVSEGHRVLHSTRHGPLEFGKDVISVAPDGIPCAYQLKGNPGGRLNRTQFREILEQLQELVTTAIPYPGLPAVQHRSYLVTNGMVEEDVILLIAQMNETWRRNGYGDEALKVVTRGELIAMACGTGTSLWPFSVSGLEGVVAMLGHRGDDILPMPKVHALLADIYGLEGDATIPPVELTRLVSSAAMLLSISMRNFASRQNHFAVLSGWTLYITYTVAAIEKHGVGSATRAENALAAARKSVLASLVDLLSEVCSRDDLVEGDLWTDSEFIGPRTALVTSLAALYCLWLREDDVRSALLTDVEQWMTGEITASGLWGEAGIPQLLTQFWGIVTLPHGSIRYDLLEAVLEHVVRAQLGMEGATPLTPPYYGADEVIRHTNVAYLPGLGDPLEGDDPGKHSFSAMGLMHLLVRLDRKAFCKEIWPGFTRLIHRSFVPRHPWQFCLVRSEEGRDDEIILPPRGDWADMQAAAEDFATPEVPERLRSDPVMLLLFVIICPHRATPAVVRYLGSHFGDPLDMADPRPALFSG